jgi:hypothetical protein
MSKKFLVVLTSHEKYPDMNRATGVWLGEAVHFVKKVEEAGLFRRLCQPAGRLRADRPAQLGDGRTDRLRIACQARFHEQARYDTQGLRGQGG